VETLLSTVYTDPLPAVNCDMVHVSFNYGCSQVKSSQNTWTQYINYIRNDKTNQCENL